MQTDDINDLKPWQKKIHKIVYEADTFKGKLFDVILLILIVISTLTVVLETVPKYTKEFHYVFLVIEWVITGFFTIEYILRIISIKKPSKYIFSFYGIIDLLSTLPMYLSYFVFNVHHLLAIRALRLLRIFRILKLTNYIGESEHLMKALKASKHKISVFLMAVFMIVIILGTLMYVIENGHESGFESIPISIYWAIVTLTTVGYGDIAPITPLGQFVASIVMIMGYGIIAVPTGIVTSELTKNQKVNVNTQICEHCHADKHTDSADYCYNCGEKLS